MVTSLSPVYRLCTALAVALPMAGSCTDPIPVVGATGETPLAQVKAAVERSTVEIRTQKGKRIPVQVEVVRTPKDRERGLMDRESLPPDAGMFFVMGSTRIHTFWMKNTPLELDMLFIAPSGDIVGIVERAEPETQTPRRVAHPSRFVLEVNGGWCAAQGVQPGDRVSFSEALRGHP